MVKNVFIIIIRGQVKKFYTDFNSRGNLHYTNVSDSHLFLQHNHVQETSLAENKNKASFCAQGLQMCSNLCNRTMFEVIV